MVRFTLLHHVLVRDGAVVHRRAGMGCTGTGMDVQILGDSPGPLRVDRELGAVRVPDHVFVFSRCPRLRLVSVGGARGTAFGGVYPVLVLALDHLRMEVGGVGRVLGVHVRGTVAGVLRAVCNGVVYYGEKPGENPGTPLGVDEASLRH